MAAGKMTKTHLSLIGIVALSVGVAIIYQVGVYGFGVDYYAAYHKPNISWGGPFVDSLGWRLSTLSLDGLHLGVFVVSLATAIATFSLLWFFLRPVGPAEIGLTITAGMLLCHSWPVLMGNLNGMRQALMMSALFFLLLSQGSRWWLTVCLLLLLAPLHKSGLFFLGAYGMSAGLHILERWRFSLGLRLFAAVLGAAATYMALLFYLDGEQQSRVIGGDFRALFLIINCVLAASFWVYRAQSPFFRYSFVFNVIALAVLAVGGNWEYERVNMVYLIPNMLAVALLFQRSARIPLMLFASAALFVMTVWAGMFDALS